MWPGQSLANAASIEQGGSLVMLRSRSVNWRLPEGGGAGPQVLLVMFRSRSVNWRLPEGGGAGPQVLLVMFRSRSVNWRLLEGGGAGPQVLLVMLRSRRRYEVRPSSTKFRPSRSCPRSRSGPECLRS
jgi:hypothetical protein